MSTELNDREIKYLKDFGFDTERYLLMPESVAKHLKAIPGSAACCIALEDEDSQKYFDEIGYHLVARKWAESSNNGIMEIYDNWKSGLAPVKEPINKIPNMTPQQAFDAPEKQTVAPPPPMEVVNDAPAGPPPPQEKTEEFINTDTYGNPRDPNVASLVAKLVGGKNKTEFLYARDYKSDNENKFFGPNNEMFTFQEVDKFSAGQFYDAYLFKTKEAKAEAAVAEANKPAETQTSIEDRKKQLEKLGFEMDKFTYVFKRGSDKVSHSKLQVLKDGPWNELIESFAKEDEEEKFMLEQYEKRKKHLDVLGFKHNEESDMWVNTLDSSIHNGDVVTMSEKDFAGVYDAFSKKMADHKAKLKAEKEQAEADKLKAEAAERIAKREAMEKAEAEKHVPEEIKEIANASNNIIIASVPKFDNPEHEELADKMNKAIKAIDPRNIGLEVEIGEGEGVVGPSMSEIEVVDEEFITKEHGKVFTNFFSKILGYRFKSIQLGINRLDDKQVGNPDEQVTVTLNVTPFKEDEAFSSLPSLVFKAKVDEFDNTFFSEIEKPLGAAEKMFSNSDRFLEELEKAEANSKKEKVKKDKLEKAQKDLKDYLAKDKQTDTTLRKKIEAVLELDPEDKDAKKEASKMQQQSLI